MKTFVRLYHDYVGRYSLTRDFYGVPRQDRQPGEHPVKYRGLDRDTLAPLHRSLLGLVKTDETTDAEVALAELEDLHRSSDGFMFRIQDDRATWL